MFIGAAFGLAPVNAATQWSSLWTALAFLVLTGVFLVVDLDRPRRFLYVLLRANGSSWLVRGGYAIMLYGALLTLVALATAFRWERVGPWALWGTSVLAIVTAVYTAFLFAQGKGRDLWQSPMLSLHMLVQSLMLGGAVCMLLAWAMPTTAAWDTFLQILLQALVAIHMLVLTLELFSMHPTSDAARTARMITRGRFRVLFWGGSIVIGHVLPYLVLANPVPSLWPLAGVLVLVGGYITDHIWVRAPQLIPLS
jgi:formate-dependent nitrite reductase membrane component NrfD